MKKSFITSGPGFISEAAPTTKKPSNSGGEDDR